MAYSEKVTTAPCKWFCISLGLYVLFLFAMMALVQRMGSDFLNYQQEVPLYLRENYFKQVADAVDVSKLDNAEASSTTPTVQLERVTKVDSKGNQLVISLIYETMDRSSIYTEKIINRIFEFEQGFLSSEFYKANCLLNWSDEQIDAMNKGFYDNVTAWNQAELPDCVRPQTQLVSCNPTLGTSCTDATATPVGILNCDKTSSSCDIEEMTVSQSFMDDKLNQIWSMGPSSSSLKTFYSTTTAKFGVEGQSLENIAAFRSTFYLGLPLKGYENTDTNTDVQETKLQNEVIDGLLASFLDEATKIQESVGVNMWFDGVGFRMGYLQRLIPADMSWAAASFMFVWLYLIVMKRSFVLATMTMGMLFLSFAPAYFLYWGVLRQQYFGIFNLLTIFIVIGIGVDDAFVFHDTWEHSEHAGHEVSGNRQTRMSWTMKRAGGAMLVTSLTTMTSFLATARSDFPGISTFGFFAACMVFMNYVLVMTYFPAAVAVCDTYYKKQFCCCQPKKEATIAPAPTEAGEKPTQSQEQQHHGQATGKKNAIVRYFEHTHPVFVYKYRFVLTGLFLIILGVFGYFAAQLEADSEIPNMFPKGNNFGEYSISLQEHFAGAFGSNPYAVKLSAVHGLQAEVINRDGTNPAMPSEKGVANYVEDFSLRKLAPCAFEICNRFGQANEKMGLHGNGKNEVRCWAQVLRNNVYTSVFQENATIMWTKAVEGDGSDSVQLWNEMFRLFVSSAAFNLYRINVLTSLDQQTGAFDDRLSVLDVTTSKEISIPFDEGIDFVEHWRQQLKDWHSKPAAEGGIDECYAIKDLYPVATYGRFAERFYTSKALVREAFSGILLSLILAFIILTVFSGNILVGLYSSFCILGVVVCVLGLLVMQGGKLGTVESINLVMVPGLSVDFIAHLAEGYIAGSFDLKDRQSRMTASLVHVGVSIVSGALSTIGSCVFLFMPTIQFFVQFGQFICYTIVFSLFFSLFGFTALMYIIGPQNDTGMIACVRKMKETHESSVASEVERAHRVDESN